VCDSIVQFDRVSYQYPRSRDFALKNITLHIPQGEFLGLIGPTGAGKTTLCLSLNGIVPQFFGGRFFGHITVAGLDTLDHPISTMARHVGVVFEDPEAQITATSVENEIAFALENLKVPRDEISSRIPRVLEAVRLEGTEKKHPHELSGGQKQRLAIAAALALQPDLLILDEPTSQLDPIGSQEVFATVRELNQEMGITIVMASHAAEEMAEYMDRIALLVFGELLKTGLPDDIYGEVEYLQSHALRPPQVASTFYLINKYGLSIPHIPVRFQQGFQMLEDIKKTALVNIHPPTNLPQSRIPDGKPLLSVNDLQYIYGDGTHALHGISLEIQEGEYVLIIGQNGAGKSTLVKHFLKLLEPTAGSVFVSDVDTRELTVSDLARRIGYVAQNPDNQIFNATVLDEVTFALKNLAYSQAEVDVRSTESLTAMGLYEDRDRHPLSLPKGDRARVVIAAILAMHPEIIIFDEPTTGQDYRGAKYILEISRNLHKMGKTIIVITHHLYLMPEYAERVIVMGKGTILLDAPIRRAFHEIGLLNSTYLTPPQSVLLTQALGDGQSFPLLTPQELAMCVTGQPLEINV
jgi:energy-coupling factor transporter ATP-binding protein EcfA2